jgi:hypothetical protein
MHRGSFVLLRLFAGFSGVMNQLLTLDLTKNRVKFLTTTVIIAAMTISQCEAETCTRSEDAL